MTTEQIFALFPLDQNQYNFTLVLNNEYQPGKGNGNPPGKIYLCLRIPGTEESGGLPFMGSHSRA